jgi:PPOX class probable F420-dependent enzyme
MAAIPENFKDLFTKKAFAHVATLMTDGTPHVSPVWVEFDGKNILLNSAKGRVKDKNMRRNKNIALSIQDPENPYRYIQVRGEVIEVTENGADGHIDHLSKKYTGDIYKKRQPGEVRVTYKIRPDRVFTMG